MNFLEAEGDFPYFDHRRHKGREQVLRTETIGGISYDFHPTSTFKNKILTLTFKLYKKILNHSVLA